MKDLLCTFDIDSPGDFFSKTHQIEKLSLKSFSLYFDCPSKEKL